MNIKTVATILVAATILGGCGGGDYSPRPQAYLRLDMPNHQYSLCDTALLPFCFEIDNTASLTLKTHAGRDVWADLEYPQWNGVVFLTYKRLASPGDLRGQTDTSVRLLEKHYQFASGIDEKAYEDFERQVHGTVWKLRGRQVASTCQFFVTDSSHHFLRGALYINRAPNNDSLSPVLQYIQEDIYRLVETLKWR